MAITSSLEQLWGVCVATVWGKNLFAGAASEAARNHGAPPYYFSTQYIFGRKPNTTIGHQPIFSQHYTLLVHGNQWLPYGHSAIVSFQTFGMVLLLVILCIYLLLFNNIQYLGLLFFRIYIHVHTVVHVHIAQQLTPAIVKFYSSNEFSLSISSFIFEGSITWEENNWDPLPE